MARAFLTQAVVSCLWMASRAALASELTPVVANLLGLLQAPMPASDVNHARHAISIALRYVRRRRHATARISNNTRTRACLIYT
jgi:alkylation response protein AidB-like acyl-CoA dehydrogenase